MKYYMLKEQKEKRRNFMKIYKETDLEEIEKILLEIAWWI